MKSAKKKKINDLKLAGAIIIHTAKIDRMKSDQDKAYEYWRRSLQFQIMKGCVTIPKYPKMLNGIPLPEWVTLDELQHVFDNEPEEEMKSFLLH